MNDILSEKEYQHFIMDYLKNNNGYIISATVGYFCCNCSTVIFFKIGNIIFCPFLFCLERNSVSSFSVHSLSKKFSEITIIAPSNIWMDDVQIFYSNYLKNHALGERINSLLFHRKYKICSMIYKVLPPNLPYLC